MAHAEVVTKFVAELGPYERQISAYEKQLANMGRTLTTSGKGGQGGATSGIPGTGSANRGMDIYLNKAKKVEASFAKIAAHAKAARLGVITGAGGAVMRAAGSVGAGVGQSVNAMLGMGGKLGRAAGKEHVQTFEKQIAGFFEKMPIPGFIRKRFPSTRGRDATFMGLKMAGEGGIFGTGGIFGRRGFLSGGELFGHHTLMDEFFNIFTEIAPAMGALAIVAAAAFVAIVALVWAIRTFVKTIKAGVKEMRKITDGAEDALDTFTEKEYLHKLHRLSDAWRNFTLQFTRLFDGMLGPVLDTLSTSIESFNTALMTLNDTFKNLDDVLFQLLSHGMSMFSELQKFKNMQKKAFAYTLTAAVAGATGLPFDKLWAKVKGRMEAAPGSPFGKQNRASFDSLVSVWDKLQLAAFGAGSIPEQQLATQKRIAENTKVIADGFSKGPSMGVPARFMGGP